MASAPRDESGDRRKDVQHEDDGYRGTVPAGSPQRTERRSIAEAAREGEGPGGMTAPPPASCPSWAAHSAFLKVYPAEGTAPADDARGDRSGGFSPVAFWGDDWTPYTAEIIKEEEWRRLSPAGRAECALARDGLYLRIRSAAQWGQAGPTGDRKAERRADRRSR